MHINYLNDCLALLRMDGRFNVDLPENPIDLDLDPKIPRAIQEYFFLEQNLNWYWQDPIMMDQPASLFMFYRQIDFGLKTQYILENAQREQGNLWGFIALENEDRDRWEILLNGSDDPPVYLSASYASAEGALRKLYANSFSDFIYSQVFDWQYRILFQDNWVQEVIIPPSFEIRPHESVFTLLKPLKAAPVTEYFWYDDSNKHYRYHLDDQRRCILKVTNGFWEVEAAGKTEAATDAALKELKQLLQPVLIED